jgi:hypothetical protein
MDLLLPLAVVFLLAVIAVSAVATVVLPRMRRRRHPEAHDEQLRAGVDPATDIGTATDRATGTTAWMRPGGGGV